MFSDYQLHLLVDGGRGAVPRTPDVGAGNGTFRTASLRNVARTAPFMHDGAFTTLDQVFEFYKRTDDNGDPLLRRLRVPDGSDRADVIASSGR
ncbi:MAG: Di-heme cytochrome c peroxidase family protein [Myxococcaceae bacterium]|nr:Di-heme cytochrome c peroxidase family protein [Myxococcaceae bacterium]